MWAMAVFVLILSTEPLAFYSGDGSPVAMKFKTKEECEKLIPKAMPSAEMVFGSLGKVSIHCVQKLD